MSVFQDVINALVIFETLALITSSVVAVKLLRAFRGPSPEEISAIGGLFAGTVNTATSTDLYTVPEEEDPTCPPS